MIFHTVLAPCTAVVNAVPYDTILRCDIGPDGMMRDGYHKMQGCNVLVRVYVHNAMPYFRGYDAMLRYDAVMRCC